MMEKLFTEIFCNGERSITLLNGASIDNGADGEVEVMLECVSIDNGVAIIIPGFGEEHISSIQTEGCTISLDFVNESDCLSFPFNLPEDTKDVTVSVKHGICYLKWVKRDTDIKVKVLYSDEG